ncbi:hypothetical protein BDN72DRAFT_964560 [Pluteus cervinus]|uniref:Uncharacterized protein n=1 Tax=Pluteus cervinus TaxID=181527 RepID=A0ACD3A9X1_9AGAR|nr:hypothetical protein BDN72DRAFT_964560 [Pluteus cervinus]
MEQIPALFRRLGVTTQEAPVETVPPPNDPGVKPSESPSNLGPLSGHGEEDLWSNARLPHDVLEHIFLLYQEANEDSMKSALVVASICRHWRITALSVPLLWSNMQVSTNDRCSSINLATEWLPRCRRISLTLRWTEERPELDGFLTSLRESGAILQRANVDFQDEDYQKRCFPVLIEHHRSTLEELVIADDLPLDDLLLPNIKRLYLNQFPQSWSSSLPPTSLTTLCLTAEIHLEALTTLLLNCPFLKQIFVTIGEAAHRFSDDANSIQTATTVTPHHHLRYLGISGDDANIAGDLLHKFAFPSLYVLEYRPWDTALPEMQWLISHPLLPSIKRLTLQLEDDSSEMDLILRSVLRLTDSLEELLIYSSFDAFSIVLSVLSKARCVSPDSNSTNTEDLALYRLKRLHFALDAKFIDIDRSYRNSLRNLLEIWAPINPASDSNPTTSRPSLIEFSLVNWSDDENDATKLRNTIQMKAAPTCHIRLVRLEQDFWTEQFPLAFEMFPLPFSDTQRYRLLSPAGEWESKTGPIYHTW